MKCPHGPNAQRYACRHCVACVAARRARSKPRIDVQLASRLREEGETYRSIAAVFGVTPQAVHWRLRAVAGAA